MSASSNSRPCYENEIDFVEYIKVIYKHCWMIISIVFLSMLFVGISSLTAPKMYEAQATFFPLKTTSNIGTEAITTKPVLDIEDLIISVLTSRKMADRIVGQLDIKRVWDKKLMVDARRVLSDASRISLEKNGIIKLSVKTKSPELSAKIANAYVDNLDYFNRQLNIVAQRNIVQVIDRATVPERRMSRGLKKKVIPAGIISVMAAVFLAFFIEYVQNSNMIKRLKEK